MLYMDLPNNATGQMSNSVHLVQSSLGKIWKHPSFAYSFVSLYYYVAAVAVDVDSFFAALTDYHFDPVNSIFV